MELAELLRSGQVHARELVEAALVRLEDQEGRINAFSFVDAERALAAAETISPDDPRPFAGVPITVKDGTPERGKPMRIGSSLFKDHVPDHDSASVRRKVAGFITVGRTTMPEFGILPTTEPRLGGPTRNPWDTSLTPGGSSDGSATAVAAGVIPVAHGSDGGGSLRIPAACYGLVGLQASRERVSFSPDRGNDPLVTIGVLTRTVAETTALLDVLAGYEPGTRPGHPRQHDPSAKLSGFRRRACASDCFSNPRFPRTWIPHVHMVPKTLQGFWRTSDTTSKPSTWNRLRSRNGKRSTTYGRCSRRRG